MTMVETTRFKERSQEVEMLVCIERTLEIGDSIVARRLLGIWIDRNGSPLDDMMQSRLKAAKARLAALASHEALHGLFSLLDRQAPEIVDYELEVKRRRKVSLYDTPGRSYGDGDALKINTSASEKEFSM